MSSARARTILFLSQTGFDVTFTANTCREMNGDLTPCKVTTRVFGLQQKSDAVRVKFCPSPQIGERRSQSPRAGRSRGERQGARPVAVPQRT